LTLPDFPMLIIRKQAFARAGLVGNPSDGYHGQTISFIIRDYAATVILYEWDEIEILGSREEKSRFNSIQHLARDVKLHGYYGGVRLVKAAIRRFFEHCGRQHIKLHDRNFSIRYESQIPRQVGLAGSSAIIVATLRCLMEFYGVSIPLEVQPSLALSVETEELGIAAGLQDRVIQIYEGLVYMNFAQERMREQAGLRFGVYERLDPTLLPPVYVAYKADVSEPTEVFHNDIRSRFQRGEPAVVDAMKKFASLADTAREAIRERDATRLSTLMDTNFDTRRSIYQLPQGQVEMVESARRVGASAKFAGSGGAIVGVYRDEAMFESLKRELGKLHCVVIKPRIQA
jgi:mevalonate kinase